MRTNFRQLNIVFRGIWNIASCWLFISRTAKENVYILSLSFLKRRYLRRALSGYPRTPSINFVDNANNFANRLITQVVDFVVLEPDFKGAIGKLPHQDIPMIKVGVNISFWDLLNNYKVTVRFFQGFKHLSINEIGKALVAHIFVFIQSGLKLLNFEMIIQVSRHLFLFKIYVF